MKWRGKEISSLTNEELWAAIQSVADMDNFKFDKLKDPRINKPKHRLNKIFNSNPPIENPIFINLVNELKLEWKKRNENT